MTDPSDRAALQTLAAYWARLTEETERKATEQKGG
jgi:hypothetical protein